MINFTEVDKAKFWSKVNIKDLDSCWEWLAGINSDGYGNFYCGITLSAHRTAWELTNGEIPEGKLCLHKRHCSNRKCVNPNHLYIGDHSANNCDREAVNPGTAGRRCSVGAAGIIAIRKLYNDGFSQKSIAKSFGIGVWTVHRICRGITGQHTLDMEGVS